ncbi:MAG TPA: hypothetical protein VMV10_12805 [Pirellulales bacterium]|nr:hypothetical protein [Pirellulales bacterium]
MAFDPYWQWLEIPPDRRPADFYALLGLAPLESDPEKIRSAGLARTAHVRRFCLGPHGAEATRLLGELANAFSCLEDPPRKQVYDDSLRVPHPPSEHVEVADGRPASDRAEQAPPRQQLLRPIRVPSVAAGAIAEAPPRVQGQVARPRVSRGVRSARLAARRRARRRSAKRTVAWLVAGCALLAAAIAVAAREKSVSLDPDSPAASNVANSAPQPQIDKIDEPQPPEPVSEPVEKPPTSAPPLPTPPADQDDEPPNLSPVDKSEASDSATNIEPEIRASAPAAPAAPEPESPAPASSIQPQSPQNVAQNRPPGASKNEGARADAVDRPAADGPPAEADDSLEKLKRLQQDAEAQDKLTLGAAALQEGNYNVAIHNFAAAIEECEYRYNDVTRMAARQLDFALGSLKDARIPPGEIVREARKTLKEFRQRIERSKRRPAVKR